MMSRVIIFDIQPLYRLSFASLMITLFLELTFYLFMHFTYLDGKDGGYS